MEPTLGSQVLGVVLIATIAFVAGWYGNRMDARKRAKKERLERMQAELVAQYEEDMRLYHEEQQQAEMDALAIARKGITPAFEY
nr:MAG TPA: cell division protein [Caudoviricetes sp.]